MGTRKASERHVRNITKNGTGSYSVTLPIDLVEALGWRRGQKIVIAKKGVKLVIEDWQP